MSSIQWPWPELKSKQIKATWEAFNYIGPQTLDFWKGIMPQNSRGLCQGFPSLTLKLLIVGLLNQVVSYQKLEHSNIENLLLKISNINKLPNPPESFFNKKWTELKTKSILDYKYSISPPKYEATTKKNKASCRWHCFAQGKPFPNWQRDNSDQKIDALG